MNDINKEKNVPEKKFKASPLIATIWSNEILTSDGQPRTFRTVTLERNYKDKDGKWKKTSSLRVNDIPKAILVLSKVYEYINMDDLDHVLVE